MTPATPSWVERMGLCRWYALSGDHPDLGLLPTASGTRYLIDTDPARDPSLNPARTAKERLRRWIGREPKSPWHGVAGFSAITEGWNSAVFASRYGGSGSMIVFGGGHNDYFGSDVHAFDVATREWRRITDGYVAGAANDYGAGARYPDTVYPDGSPLPPHTYDYVQYDPVGNDYILFKGQTELGPRVKAAAVPHLFNLDTLVWRHGPRHPTAILNSGGWTTWDASRRVIWGHSGDDGSGNAFIGFSPDRDNGDGTYGHWSEHFPNKLPGLANHNAMQIDPHRDVIVVSVHARNELYAIDPTDPARKVVQLNAAGAKPTLHPYASTVAILVDGWGKPGSHEVTFDGSNLASGIYFVRFTAGRILHSSETDIAPVINLASNFSVRSNSSTGKRSDAFCILPLKLSSAIVTLTISNYYQSLNP